jgi:hypothetical protein
VVVVAMMMMMDSRDTQLISLASLVVTCLLSGGENFSHLLLIRFYLSAPIAALSFQLLSLFAATRCGFKVGDNITAIGSSFHRLQVNKNNHHVVVYFFHYKI